MNGHWFYFDKKSHPKEVHRGGDEFNNPIAAHG
jgi:hypothetical protein